MIALNIDLIGMAGDWYYARHRVTGAIYNRRKGKVEFVYSCAANGVAKLAKFRPEASRLLAPYA
jgi:hypothetical protein